MIHAIAFAAMRPLLPWLLLGVLASHGGAIWYGWHWRGGVEAARLDRAQAALRLAQARVLGLIEAQAAATAERNALREELDHAAATDPDADRLCLGADSVQRLRTR